MKMKRSELKGLIKECLVEILQEGLGTVHVASPGQVKEARRDWSAEPLPGVRPSPGLQPRRSNHLDQVVHSRQMPVNETRSRPQPTAVVPREFAHDPVMSSIFADTAASMRNGDPDAMDPTHVDPAHRAASKLDPVQMFGEEQMEQWNRAAFAPARPFTDQSAIQSILGDPRGHNSGNS